jgi:hypothetical protein
MTERIPRTMIIVVETGKNDNVHCRFIQFTVVIICRVTFGRYTITTVFDRAVHG